MITKEKPKAFSNDIKFGFLAENYAIEFLIFTGCHEPLHPW
jgi:hypothetical protein